ncbi:putative zinc-containing alcohol dehydrogenase [Triangularia verruculosa]|uniref:Zinc-containing alcohol dehydrogenase n=1 Tax=Triangularia verruculosa TaxID=2587418 RepID=A0AAN6XN44_9PEZI|nr:putative zinc-containing alcohol dehydrogenase [Triangularia verruculosa]
MSGWTRRPAWKWRTERAPKIITSLPEASQERTTTTLSIRPTMTNNRQLLRWLTDQDGIENLKTDTIPMPKPGKDEVLVKISAVSLNYRDTEVVMGLYNYYDKPGEPKKLLVPTSDMCGIIVAVGDESTDPNAWQVGDRVVSTFLQSHLSGQVNAQHLATGLGKPLDGCLQTYRIFPNTGLVRAPKHLTDEEASCLPIAAVTAWMSINGMQPMGEIRGDGETVVLQGTGGVSISGLQIAKASGAKTIITSSSDEKLQKAKALGADHVINYRTNPSWEEEVMKITGNAGADVIIETGGAGTLYKSLDCIGFGGLISCVGYVSGREDKAGEARPNLNLLALRRTVTLKGIINGPKDRFEEMCQFYEKHQIRPVVDRVFSFKAASEAFKYLASGSHFGKVVVKVD